MWPHGLTVNNWCIGVSSQVTVMLSFLLPDTFMAVKCHKIVVKIRLSYILGNMHIFCKKCINFFKITPLKSMSFQRKCIFKNDTIKCNLDWLQLFHQKRKQVISFLGTMLYYCYFATDIIFSTD